MRAFSTRSRDIFSSLASSVFSFATSNSFSLVSRNRQKMGFDNRAMDCLGGLEMELEELLYRLGPRSFVNTVVDTVE